MKILFFNYEYPPLGGGAANANSYIFEEFQKIPDLKIDFITSSVDAKYHLEKMGERIRIHRLPIGKNPKNLHYQSRKELLVYAWKAYWFAKKLVKFNKYDLSHSFFTVPCGFVSYLFKKQYKIPYIISLRGSDVPGYSLRFGAIYGFLTPIIKLIWRNAMAVISNSQGLKELALRSAPKQDISVIFNGIATDEFRPIFRVSEGSTFGEKVEPSGASSFTVLCVSRITERKGIRYLIEAVVKLAEKYPQIRLRIVGEGDRRAELEKAFSFQVSAFRVEFLGRVEHGNLAKIYQAADVFVLPSLNEGMSNTILEALSTGLPLVATDTGGTQELLTNGENGFIIKMKDSADIAEKIEKLINDPELTEKMGGASRKKAEGMSWGNVAKQYYNLYLRIV